MTALSTEARLELHQAFIDAGLPSYSYVPETPSPPAVIVLPDDPYIEPNRLGARLAYRAHFIVAVIVQALDNETALTNAEALIDSVLTAVPSGVTVDRVSRPALDSLGAQGAVYVVEINVSAQVEGVL